METKRSSKNVNLLTSAKHKKYIGLRFKNSKEVEGL